MARPTAYAEKTAKTIIEQICSGVSLSQICRDESLPARSTVLLWVANDREGFSDRYAKACQARAYFWADELLDIADDSTNDFMIRKSNTGEEYEASNPEAIARSRLRVDTRKWLMSKLLNTYADKPEVVTADPTADKIIEIIRAVRPTEDAK